jgi:hypothetical protein
MNIMLVNNTGTDIRGMVENAVMDAVRNEQPLPEELADIFNLEVRMVDGSRRAFLSFS